MIKIKENPGVCSPLAQPWRWGPSNPEGSVLHQFTIAREGFFNKL